MAVYFGADYYPEHWPRDRWERDAELMEALGLDVVRMAEFSWQKMESAEGVFHFEWLDEAVALLAKRGIKTVLGTPTAAPPAWIIQMHPDILPVDGDGHRKGFGGRHHDCQSNVHYREHVRRFVGAMAAHFAHNPHVVAWQIDNELGNSHGDLCHCDSCRAAFHTWLENKYKTIDALNEAWGTAFWSQGYDTFSQIPTASRRAMTGHNPSLLLDWRRFCSDLVCDFARFQIGIIRKAAPSQPITHNFMGFCEKSNYFDLARDMDFVTSDQYPLGYYFSPPIQRREEIAACHDFTRGFKKKNFWMMEMQSGPTGGGVIGRMPRPGQTKLWTAQSIAHGADTVVYFRWRTCTFGTEQFWHGILPHHGEPGRIYHEIADTIRTFKPVLQDVRDVQITAQTAILFSYDDYFALKDQRQHPDLTYVGQIKKYHAAFNRHNIPVDFISDTDDLGPYKLVVAPLQYLLTAERERAFRDYVARGGNLVLTMRTGVKDSNNVCQSHAPLPGSLGDMLGITIPEYDCPLGLDVSLEWENGRTGRAEKWCDIITTAGAETLARYGSEYYAGQAAVTVNRYGGGRAYYVGAEPDEESLGAFAYSLASELGIRSPGESPAEVEICMRSGRTQDHLFVLNHGDTKKDVTLESAWGGRCTVDPYGVVIVSKQRV